MELNECMYYVSIFNIWNIMVIKYMWYIVEFNNIEVVRSMCLSIFVYFMLYWYMLYYCLNVIMK